jgi:hypothetical protein
MSDTLRQLEAWITQEGVETGGRQLASIDYDCNWGSRSFLVILLDRQANEQYRGHGPNCIGGLEIALNDALAKARGEA